VYQAAKRPDAAAKTWLDVYQLAEVKVQRSWWQRPRKHWVTISLPSQIMCRRRDTIPLLSKSGARSQ